MRSECVWEVSTVRRKVGVTELTPAVYAGHSSLVWSVSNVDDDATKYTVPRNNGRFAKQYTSERRHLRYVCVPGG